MTNLIQKINKEQFNNWLNTAIPFSVWRWSNKKHIIKARDFIFKEIGEEYRNSRDKAKDMDMLLVFLLNLWVGFCIGCPIQISMSSNRYSKNSAYSKVFFTYKRTRRILEALERKGYLQRANGIFFEDIKRDTRIWGTEKLIRLFVEDYHFQPVGDVITLKQHSLIQLRDKKIKNIKDKKTGRTRKVKYSVPIEFEPTERTQCMEENLMTYNTQAKEETVTMKLTSEDLVTPSALIDEILQGLVSGTIRLVDSELSFKEPVVHQFYSDNTHSSELYNPVDSVFSGIPGLMITSVSYKQYSYVTTSNNDDHIEHIHIDALLPSITHTLHSQQWQCFRQETAIFLYLFYMKKMFNLLKIPGRNKKIRARKRKEIFNKERPLADFGIQSLEFEINKKALHRVFNDASLDFDKGGRFYGSFYQGLSENLRKKIYINGHETVEIDYSAMHPRMLYHMENIEYKGDPYQIGDDSFRGEYKIVTLISINAKKQGAHVAVKDALDDAGFAVADDLKSVQGLMKNYQQAHKPIEKYLFSGVGLDLQNKDSQIMEKILMQLHGHEIVGLPVHDSVIVEKQHHGLLYQIMMEEYEKVMGFEPVLK